jgi:uncharacterized membrane protein
MYSSMLLGVIVSTLIVVLLVILEYQYSRSIQPMASRNRKERKEQARKSMQVRYANELYDFND